jgi:hypothetical protein
VKYGNGEICYRRVELPTIDGRRFEQGVTISRVDSDELRATILALWVALDSEQRNDMIKELIHYDSDPIAQLPEIALASCHIAHGFDGEMCPSEKGQMTNAITRAV